MSVLTQNTQKESPNTSDVKVLDGAAVVHFLCTTTIITFDEYASSVFVSYVMKHLGSSNNVDVAWDTYITSSIKGSARENQCKGIRGKVSGQNKSTGNWPDFLSK
jgi:hypothetical protein